MMLPSRGPGRRAVVGAVGAVALAGAMFVGSAAAASAEPPMPPPPAPPNCSPADWAGVRAGVAAATSTYLFTHPRERLLRDPRRRIQRRNASWLTWTPTRRFGPTSRASSNPQSTSWTAVATRIRGTLSDRDHTPPGSGPFQRCLLRRTGAASVRRNPARLPNETFGVS